jgi:hypothetical protein
MRKYKPAPVEVDFLDKGNNVATAWRDWFQYIGKKFDDIRRPPDIIYTTDATLKSDDFGKVIRFDNSAGNLVCRLPTVTSRDINCWLTVFRTGVGRLTVVCDAATRIDNSTYGGRIWCEETRRAGANVTLQLVTATQWAITGATGIWRVR